MSYNKRGFLRFAPVLLGTLVLLSYQNCSVSKNNESFSSSENQQYAHLSVEAQEQMLLAEDDIRSADLDVHNFFDVIAEVQKLIEYINAHPLKKKPDGENSLQVTQQIFLENLGIQVNLMGHFLNALNSIPALNSKQVDSLSRAISRIKAIEGLGPTENFLLGILSMIELKQIILTQFFPQGTASTVPIGAPTPNSLTNTESLQQGLLRVETTLQVFSDAMKIARPSMNAELEKFEQTFLTALKQVSLLTVKQETPETLQNGSSLPK
jgi:hypothetical protein